MNIPFIYIFIIFYKFYLVFVYLTITTRKLGICGGPIAAGTKTAAIGHLLRRIFGPSLYMRSIAAVYMPTAIALAFCGVL